MSSLEFPVEKAGVLDTIRALTVKERQHYLALRARGIDDETARQLARGMGDAGKVGKAASAGALAAHYLEALGEQPTTKSVGPAGAVHVDRPLGSDKKKPKKKKPKLEDDEETKELTVSKSPHGMVGSEDTQSDVDLGPDTVGIGRDRYKDAQRLVAGMDYELQTGAENAEDARSRASRNLAHAWKFYDTLLQPDPELRSIDGIDVDLGSGQSRTPGYLGLDIYPYDFGTAVWDVTMGLPFGNNSVRSYHLNNALAHMGELAYDATPLLREVQRTLNYGGQLHYEGNEDLAAMADLSCVPGLVLVDHSDSAPLNGRQQQSGPVYRQDFARVRVAVPTVFGADGTWLGFEEESSGDLEQTDEDMGGQRAAERVMASLFDPDAEADMPPGPVSVGLQASAVGAEPMKQIVYCVVTAPNEIDTDGEYMDAACIEEAAHMAMLDGLEIRVEHGSDAVGAAIVESYIAPVTYDVVGPYGPQVIPKGAWVVGIKVFVEQIWEAIIAGKITGFSIGGTALLETR